MFEVDVKGLAELEGGKLPHRLAFEPIANVFDEFRGYGDPERRKPSFCAVTLMHSSNPRGVVLTVADDGAGFSNERDIWTFFGTTAKRADVKVAGRFNAGDRGRRSSPGERLGLRRDLALMRAGSCLLPRPDLASPTLSRQLLLPRGRVPNAAEPEKSNGN